MHVQFIAFFPNFAKDILYYLCSSVLVFKHGKGIAIEAFIPIGKSFFKYFLLVLYRICKAVIVQIQTGLCYFLKITCFWVGRRKWLIPLRVVQKKYIREAKTALKQYITTLLWTKNYDGEELFYESQ